MVLAATNGHDNKIPAKFSDDFCDKLLVFAHRTERQLYLEI